MRTWPTALLVLATAALIAGFLYWKTPPVLPATQPQISIETFARTIPATSARIASPSLHTNPDSTLAQSSEKPSGTIAATTSLPPPPVPPTFESTNLAPTTILENMRTTIRQFASTFGDNPVGTNPEITQALQGANPKQLNFLKTDGNRVNATGELVDPWGTPYFFHQLSATEMEIRSAGPDRTMYTADDLLIK